jgi:hypothetical protein
VNTFVYLLFVQLLSSRLSTQDEELRRIRDQRLAAFAADTSFGLFVVVTINIYLFNVCLCADSVNGEDVVHVGVLRNGDAGHSAKHSAYLQITDVHDFIRLIISGL